MRRDPSLKERLDKSTLAKLYELSGLSAANIAERYGTSERQITKLMQGYGIARRGRGDRKPGAASSGRVGDK
jgi:hypothetical protein